MLWLIAAALAASPAPPLRPELEPMRFLVGHCWRGEHGRGAQDTHCFETVFDGQHVRDRHKLTGAAGPYAGESIYSWNAGTGRIEYVYWNSLGGVSRGAMVARPGLLDFGDDTYTGADGRRISSSTIWRRTGERGYETVTTSPDNPTGDRIVRFTRID